MISRAHLILYVSDQRRATEFYARVLDCQPTLDVPGMSEFALDDCVVLGLMPEAGARRLLGDVVPDVGADPRVPRAELYVLADDPEALHRRALAAGAREVSPFATRDWGHWVAYSLDPDGHVLAFGSAKSPTAESTPARP